MALFIFAHQDDECWCFYEIRRLVSRGDEVKVVYLTSGTFDGNLSPVRNAESISVLGRIGVPKENIFFLGTHEKIRDGRLCESLEVVFNSLITFADEAGVLSSLYLPAWEGGHQDHDAAHLVGISLAKHFRILGQCYQFPLYTGVNLTGILFRTFTCLPENGKPIVSKIPWKDRIRFITLCFSYPSQIKSWIGLFPFFMMHHIFYGTQSLQHVSVDRVNFAPHSGTLLYERRQAYSYKIFIQKTCDFVNRLTRTIDNGI
jgi:hypothetical protein